MSNACGLWQAGTTEGSNQDWPEDGEGENYDDDAVGGKEEEGGLPSLPEECEAYKYPVVVLRNVYSKEEAEADPNFYDDLEVICACRWRKPPASTYFDMCRLRTRLSRGSFVQIFLMAVVYPEYC